VHRLEHRRDLPHLGRGHVAEDVAVPMNHAPLPSSIWEEIGGAFGKPEAGVGDDQPHAGEPAPFEMLEICRSVGVQAGGAVTPGRSTNGFIKRSADRLVRLSCLKTTG
jgi:hypothetical protein